LFSELAFNGRIMVITPLTHAPHRIPPFPDKAILVPFKDAGDFSFFNSFSVIPHRSHTEHSQLQEESFAKIPAREKKPAG